MNFSGSRSSVSRFKSLDELKEGLHDYDTKLNSLGADFQLVYERGLGTPIFRGQFAGLLSVLFCYPEAIVTLKQADVSWAKNIEMFDFDNIEVPAKRITEAEKKAKQKANAELIKDLGVSANARYAVFQANRVSQTMRIG